MDDGFILSNKFRRAVFNEIISGESDVVRIAKKHRIVSSVVEKIIGDFVNGNIVSEKNGRYFLTINGKKIAAVIRNQDKV